MNLFYGLLLSAHIGFEGNYNYFHPHIGVEFDNNLLAGAYYNSMSNMSYYLGYNHEFTDDINLEVGLVTGYRQGIAVPMAKLNYKNFFISPSAENGHAGIIIGVDWRK